MLGAVILASIVAVGLILFGLGLGVLCLLAEANSPIPGKAGTGGLVWAAAIAVAVGILLLVSVLWPEPAAAHDAPDGRTICLFVPPRSF